MTEIFLFLIFAYTSFLQIKVFLLYYDIILIKKKGGTEFLLPVHIIAETYEYNIKKY